MDPHKKNLVEIEGGATLWARQTIDSEIFYDKPDKWFKVWFYLVNRVNHKKKRRWNRGECFIIYKEIEEYTKATPDQIKKCLAFFREKGMIRTTRSTRGVTLKIPKYDYFQTLDNYYYDIKSTTQSTREALEKHQRSTPINKNDKNDKNTIAIREYWNNINLKTIGSFDSRKNKTIAKFPFKYCRRLTPDIEKEVKGHLKIYTIEDIKYAINKYAEELVSRRSDTANDYCIHRFSFYEFLKQKNGLKKFINT